MSSSCLTVDLRYDLNTGIQRILSLNTGNAHVQGSLDLLRLFSLIEGIK